MPPLAFGIAGRRTYPRATIPPTALWNAPHRAIPACDLGHYSMGFEVTDSLHTVCTIQWAGLLKKYPEAFGALPPPRTYKKLAEMDLKL